MRQLRRLIHAVLHAVLGARGGALGMMQTAMAQCLTMAVNVATGVITARLLGPTGRGEFAAVGLWLLLPSLLALAGLHNAVIYEVRQRPEQAGGIGLAGLAAATTLFMPMLLVCLWLQPLLMHTYSADIIGLARAALLLSVANVWMGMVRQWLLGIRQLTIFNAVAVGVAVAYLVLLLLLLPLHMVTPASATYAQVGSTGLGLIAVAPAVAAALRRAPVRDLARHLRAVLIYGIRAAPIDLVTVLSQNIDRLMLVSLVSAAELGRYVVALAFARILSVLQAAVSAVMLSDLAGRSPAEIADFTQVCFRLLFWLLVPACGAVFLVDRSLLPLVYGPGFGSAVPVFRILLVEAALSCLGQVFIQAFLARNASGTASTIQVTSFAVAAAGVIALAPGFGGLGAASALVAGSLLRLVLLLAAARRIGLGLPGILPRRNDLAPMLRQLRRKTAASHP